MKINTQIPKALESNYRKFVKKRDFYIRSVIKNSTLLMLFVFIGMRALVMQARYFNEKQQWNQLKFSIIFLLIGLYVVYWFIKKITEDIVELHCNTFFFKIDLQNFVKSKTAPHI